MSIDQASPLVPIKPQVALQNSAFIKNSHNRSSFCGVVPSPTNGNGTFKTFAVNRKSWSGNVTLPLQQFTPEQTPQLATFRSGTGTFPRNRERNNNTPNGILTPNGNSTHSFRGNELRRSVGSNGRRYAEIGNWSKRRISGRLAGRVVAEVRPAAARKRFEYGGAAAAPALNGNSARKPLKATVNSSILKHKRKARIYEDQISHSSLAQNGTDKSESVDRPTPKKTPRKHPLTPKVGKENIQHLNVHTMTPKSNLLYTPTRLTRSALKLNNDGFATPRAPLSANKPNLQRQNTLAE